METKFADFEVEMIESRLVFGLTGGMGSGKSSVSNGLRERGAVIIDADKIVRDLQQPGEPSVLEMAEILGIDIVNVDGSLNRGLVASRIFENQELRLETEKVLGTRIKGKMFDELSETSPDSIVTLDVPLLLEKGWNRLPLKGIIVVDTSIENAVKRLIEYRGFEEDEARRRIATQMSREQKLAYADHVVSNDGSISDLDLEIVDTWQWMNTFRKLGNFAVTNRGRE